MECNNCDRKTPDHNSENRSCENREGCSDKKDCGSGRSTNYNMNRNSNCNMNQNMNCNMNYSTNRSSNNMGRNTNCSMNRSSNNMGRNMNCDMNRSSNNMNQNMNRRSSSNMNYSTNRNSDSECRCKMTQFMSEGCNRGNEPVDTMNPGMGFVPWQEWKNVYNIEKGLERGTIFEELDKPYLGRPME